MLTTETIDSPSLKLLLKYNTLAAEYSAQRVTDVRKKNYIAEHGTSADDFARMKANGLAFDAISLTHDKAVDLCFKNLENSSKKHLTDLFLASFGSGRIEWRAGLSAYAIMQCMPKHIFQDTPSSFCAVCSGVKMDRRVDLTELNRERFADGSMSLFRTPYEIQFFLEQHNRLAPRLPTALDIEILNEICRIIRESEPKAKPAEVVKSIRRIKKLAATQEQAKGILETLGFCGILTPAGHESYFKKYTNPGLAPSKSHSSNWAYPIDFWVGSDGISGGAFNFWFGEYEKI